MPVVHLLNGKWRWGDHGHEYETREEAERQGAAAHARGDARVTRYDASSRLGRLQRTPTGGVRAPATVARSGLQTYKRADGSTQVEYRPPAEVSHADSLASFAAAAVTIGHPTTQVTADNWAALAAGTTSDRGARVDRVDGSPYLWVHTDLLLQRADAIAFAEQGAELSTGYSCVLDPTPGVVPEGEPDAGQRYDVVQTAIMANHVALLKEGCARAGGHARLRFDGSQEPLTEQTDTPPERQMPAPMIKFDGVEYEAGSASHLSALTVALEKRDARIKELETAATTAAGQHTTATATLQAKVDSLTAELAAAKGQLTNLDTLVEARQAFVSSVRPVLGAEYVFAGKTDAQIRRDCLAKLRPALKLDGKDEAWIATYFEATMAAQPEQRTDFTVNEPAKPADKTDEEDEEAKLAARVAKAREDSYK